MQKGRNFFVIGWFVYSKVFQLNNDPPGKLHDVDKKYIFLPI